MIYQDLYIYDFGIFIEVAPDEEQKAQLEAEYSNGIVEAMILI